MVLRRLTSKEKDEKNEYYNNIKRRKCRIFFLSISSFEVNRKKPKYGERKKKKTQQNNIDVSMLMVYALWNVEKRKE